MQNAAFLIPLSVGVVALGVAGYALSENISLREELEAHAVLASSEDDLGADGSFSRGGVSRGSVAERLATVEAELARRDEAAEEGPLLVGREPPLPIPLPSGPESPEDEAAVAEQLESLIGDAVDKAVDEKARKIMARANKKPSIDVFANVLGLEEAQRASVEREVVAAQHDIRDILSTPTANGTIFMDELVDIMAHGIAKPGTDVGWGKFITRVMSETIPGSDDTFGVRIESVKQRLRGAFKRDMTEQQYADFEAWKMDPSQIEQVPGSPFTELGPRILERAREMGAVIPEKGD